MTITFCDMFAGIGGFRLGLEKVISKPKGENRCRTQSISNRRNISFNKRNNTKFNCVFTTEIDKYARQIYTKNFGEAPQADDVCRVGWETIPDFDMLCAGFPCQSFSIAGKRKGFSDTRGTLFFEILRCIKVKRPSLILLENVKGLLSADGGKCFATILYELDAAGYDCEWQVLNSKDFGVPQNRERVFIVGHSRSKRICSEKIFPIRESSKKVDGKMIDVSPFNLANSNMHGPRDKSDKTTTFCLDGIASSGIKVNQKIRRLMPIECERLQGFPDGWTENGIDDKGNEVFISDTQRYKVLGNAVTTTVIQSIAEKIIRLQ